MTLKRIVLVLGLCTFVALVANLGAKPGPASASGVAGVAAGGSTTCALTTAGGLKCWGYDYYGTSPVDVPGLTTGVAAVAVGSSHTCALTAAGGVKCWGNNFVGQLGDGTTTDRVLPMDVSGLTSGVAAVAVGGQHSCALTTAGGVKCWGQGSSGQLGVAAPQDCAYYRCSTTPVNVTGLTGGVAAIAAGGAVSCAVTTAGGLKCWGGNSAGQLGATTTEGCTINIPGSLPQPCSTTPLDVTGSTSGIALVDIGDFHTCALTMVGGLKCWGSNIAGALGTTTTEECTSPSPGIPPEPCSTVPLDVTGLASGVAAVDAGGFHTCALTTAGGLKCWGSDSIGQLGAETADLCAESVGMEYQFSCSLAPVDVTGLASGIAAVAAGSSHTCAMTAAGDVKCWGSNSAGQLGTETEDCQTNFSPIPCSTTPVDVDAAKTLRGDVSCDGLVNSIDAALILQHDAGLLMNLPCEELRIADLNGDYRINSLDSLLILQYAAGLLPELPA